MNINHWCIGQYFASVKSVTKYGVNILYIGLNCRFVIHKSFLLYVVKWCCKVGHCSVTGIVHPKILILSRKKIIPRNTENWERRQTNTLKVPVKSKFCQCLSTHPQVVLNLYKFLSSVERKRRYFEEC